MKGFDAYFTDKLMKGETTISGKGPDHAGRGCEEADDGTPCESDYYRHHDRSSGFRFDSVVEDLDEGEAGG